MSLDFSSELRDGAIAGTLEFLADRYPIATTWLLGAVIDEDVPAPVTVPATRQIHIPPRSGMGPGRADLERECKNGLSIVTAHEFAHALMLAVQLEAAKGDFGQLPSYTVTDLLQWPHRPESERSAHLYTPENEIGNIVRRARAEGVSESGLGRYAASDDLELFAEAMRTYWTHEATDAPLVPFAAYVGSKVDSLYGMKPSRQ